MGRIAFLLHCVRIPAHIEKVPLFIGTIVYNSLFNLAKNNNKRHFLRTNLYTGSPKHQVTLPEPLMSQTFSVTVLVYEDGTMAVTDSDITGLIIEVCTFNELLTELPQVASDLLQLNHSLTAEQIEEIVLRIKFEFNKNTVRQQKPRPSAPLPEMFWSSNEFSHSLRQYA